MTDINAIPTERLASKLGCSAEQAGALRDRFNEDKVAHVIIADRIGVLIDEKRRLYDTCPPEDLRKIQGCIDGLTKALAAINAKE